jgi:cobalamin biosynthesis protein CobT
MGKEGKFSDALDSEEEPEDDKAEPEDKGKTSVEADDSGKTGSDESDKVEGEAEGEAPAADSSGDDEGGSGEGGDEPADEPAETEPTPKADGPDESDAGMGTESKDDKEGEGSGDEPGDSSPGADDAAPSSEGDAEGEGEPTEPADDPLADMLDSEADFDKELSKKLGETAKKETDESAYAIFSKDWDVISPARLSTSPTSAAKLEHSIKDKIGVMQKHLERGIAAQARKCWNPGQRTGRIAPGALFKTSVGDDRVFRKRFETRAKNTAVSLVIDCSGSMSGSRIELAGVTAFALASVLERIKLDYEVIGFTSGHSGEMIELMRQDADTHGESFRSMGWARMEPLYMPVFKDFKGRLDTNAKSRIAHLTEDPSWLLQNVDGECVQIAARRLKQIHAERHVMIVLSDGEPCCAAGKGLGAHLKKTVKEVTKSGVEVIGIGIQTASVKAFYPKHLVLNDLETLPTQAMAELTKLLLA